ncbi:protein HGH1 homolog [Discoglossus pictus]
MDLALVSELISFLSQDTRADVKSRALEYLLGVSGSVDGRQSLAGQPQVLQAVLDLTSDPLPVVAQDSYHIMVNLTSDPSTHPALLTHLPTLIPTLLSRVQDSCCAFADSVCTVLCNLSREEGSCHIVLRALQGQGLYQLVDMLCTPKYNSRATLEYVGPLMCNLTQLPEGRDFILDRSRCVVQRLLPYTQSGGSTVRRGGIIGTLRNCCFHHRDHAWLLGDEVDLLPFLLLPLAGGEEFTEEEMETLPPDLQYLTEDKKRESDPDIRKMLIETVQLLCATPEGRRIVKKRGTYLIMRALHSWEKEADVKRACERLIQILIGDEPAPGFENLLEVAIPAEIEEKLKKLDEEEEAEMGQEETAPGQEETAMGQIWVETTMCASTRMGQPHGH